MAEDKNIESSVHSDSISVRLRKETRKVHNESDKLVSLKAVVAFADPKLYRQVLADFYLVFSTIEAACKKNKWTQQLGMEALYRKQAFEQDLEYYYGPQWASSLSFSPAALLYKERIEKVSEEEEELIVAYVYNMYLALLAGGSILRKRLVKSLRLFPSEGQTTHGAQIFNFPRDGVSLREELKKKIDQLPFERKTVDHLVEEAKLIFSMNNEIVRSLPQSARLIFLFRLFLFLCFIITLFVLLW